MKRLYPLAWIVALTLLVASFGVAAGGIVASTPWVGAMAKAAGVENVVVITPAGVAHPPDYDPRPSDLLRVAAASVILSGGYEGFAPRLAAAAAPDATQLVVQTTYDPAALEIEIRRLAVVFGTEVRADRFLVDWRREWQAGATALGRTKGTGQTRIAAHRFMQPWIGLLGVTPLAVFGPGPLTPTELARLKALGITLVVDNAHSPQGAALAEVSGARYVKLVNFPAAGEGLEDVLRGNVTCLHEGLSR